jgi:hypothetical protein
MSVRSQASHWFFAGFLVIGAVISGEAVFAFHQYVSVSGKSWSNWMSFGVYMQLAFSGAVVSALGFFVGLWIFRVEFSRRQAAFAGAVCCAALFCTMTAMWLLDFHWLDDSIEAYVFASAVFLAGFALVPLSKRVLRKGNSDVKPG